jgi:hypothetical protein
MTIVAPTYRPKRAPLKPRKGLVIRQAALIEPINQPKRTAIVESTRPAAQG